MRQVGNGGNDKRWESSRGVREGVEGPWVRVESECKVARETQI